MTDWGAVLDAVQLTLSGHHELGEKALRECWSDTTSAEHAPRCVIAHYLADLQSTVAAEVEWDERALAEFVHVSDADLAPIGVPSAKGFAPSLHLNAGDGYLRMGRIEDAWKQLESGELALQELERDGYLQFIAQGLQRLRQRLEERAYRGVMTSLPLTALDLPDQSGRTWLITGATSGIGRELALGVAAAGGVVVAPARNRERAASLVTATSGSAGRIETPSMDLADLGSVRRFANSLTTDIDVLVNNAGAVSPKRRETADGFEMLLGTNFLGPFALTNLIGDRVRERIVITGSDSYKVGRVDMNDPHFRRRRWNPLTAYSQSKLCDMLWARALQERLGSRVVVTCAHPGWAATGLQNVTGSEFLDQMVVRLTSPFSQSTADGALPLAEAAVGNYPPLSYIGPDGFMKWRGKPEAQEVSRRGRSTLGADAVWALGVRETGTDLA
ncbi:SDR family NAD(P)-dependent oxidoreductase [Kocuria sp. cx-455]|uniref:SDR family NAD(P)-dependent oxidoreductase n=1 Tax=Kocuria sp. cx-455 TaxID=2771377 RepID=UPI003D75094B